MILIYYNKETQKMFESQQNQEPQFLFNLKKEINGKKYQYAGEYPNSKSFIEKIRKLMNNSGYHIWVDFSSRKSDNKIVLWSRKK